MMDIDYKTVIALLMEPLQNDVEQRLASHGHQCLGHRVSHWFEPCAQACGEYHCLFHGCKSTNK